jgi:hypothetical protein
MPSTKEAQENICLAWYNLMLYAHSDFAPEIVGENRERLIRFFKGVIEQRRSVKFEKKLMAADLVK